MNELKPRIHDETNSLDYILVSDYYLPAIELSEDDGRPIGKGRRMHRAYLEETNTQPSDFDRQITRSSTEH